MENLNKMKCCKGTPTNYHLRGWSTLLVVAMATFLTSLQLLICLAQERNFVQQTQSSSIISGQTVGPSEQQYNSETGDDHVSFDGGGSGGEILLSNEFYLFRPGFDLVSNNQPASNNDSNNN